jgi:hypothetical protein
MTLDRRFVLKSTLATVALPRLEAMLNSHGTAYAAGGMLPKRYGLFYWGLGMDPKRWTPSTTGVGWDLSEQLKPFEPVKEYLSVATGFLCQPILGQVHVGGSAAILTGDGSDVDPYERATVRRASFDQLIAAHLGPGSKFKSLEVRSTEWLHLPSAGGSVIDWVSHNGPNSPNKAEVDPKVVFNRLFGMGVNGPNVSAAERAAFDASRKSVLDLVRKDASRLSNRLGTVDRSRLAQHLEGIRAIELQINAMPAPMQNTCKVPTAPGTFTKGQIRARNKVMAEMLAMAFACDLTRVATLQFSGGGSHDQFPDVGVNFDSHEVGHMNGITPDINRAIIFWMECFSTWLQAMKALPEGAGNVLDSSVVFGTSDHGYAPSHGYDEYPLVIAGKAQGALKTGVHVRTAKSKATRVPFTIMKALGMPLTSWGQGALQTSEVVPELLT